MNSCPICQDRLVVYYRMATEEMVCKCSNPKCVMFAKDIEATGDRTEEVLDRFRGMCLKYEKVK